MQGEHIFELPQQPLCLSRVMTVALKFGSQFRLASNMIAPLLDVALGELQMFLDKGAAIHCVIIPRR